MDFKMFCGSQCAWYNGEAKRCQLLEEFSMLANVFSRLTTTIGDAKRSVDSLVEPVKGLVKEQKNGLC